MYNVIISYTLHCRNELEADYIGMLLLAAAGFDPRVAPRFFDKLGKLHGDLKWTKLRYYFSPKIIHPSSRKRSRLLSHPKVMEEAMKLYTEAISDRQGYVDKDLAALT